MKKGLIIIAGLVLIASAGCYNDKYDQLYVAPATTTCDTTTVSFAADILPILNASCNVSGGCHDAAGKSVSGFSFTSYNADLIQNSTPALMLNDINGTPTKGHNTMPLNLPKLSQCDINKITRWVHQGAQNN